MTKEDFLQSIQEGKWFQVIGRYKDVYAVKMREVLSSGRKIIIALWLSSDAPEGMAFEEFAPKDWTWKKNTFVHYSAGVFHFGSPEEDSIYDENTGEILVGKMKKMILGYSDQLPLTEKELDEVWGKLVRKEPLNFDSLLFE